MTPERTERLLTAMREAVVLGRQMRVRQTLYFKTKRKDHLQSSILAESEFDAKSLAAIRLEEELKQQEEVEYMEEKL